MINKFEHFFNRERELKYLEEAYKMRRFSLIIIYGRRRVGKTFLVKKFLEGKNNVIYFYVSEMSSKNIRIELAKEIFVRLGIRLDYIPSWNEIYRKLFKSSRKEKVVLVFDEFQRLLEIDRSAITELQRIIDEEAEGSNIMVVCTGSSIGLMERIFKYRQPLYGRATGFLKIKPFDYITSYRYLAKRVDADPREATELYGVFGGTPYYLSLLRSKSWIEEAARLIFDNRSPLYWEPELLLKTELREHVTYFEILRLLASGKNSFSEIAGSLGSSKTSLSYYLNVLIKNLDLVEREEPLGGGRAVYKIKDNFFKFWFKYVFSNRSTLELGDSDVVVENVKEDFNTYMGQVYQEIAKQVVWKLKLPFKPFKVGGWWRRGVEIDVIAVDRKGRKAALFEVKWRSLTLRESYKILKELEEKSASLPYPVKYYGLIGLNIERIEDLRSDGYIAFELNDIVS